MFKKGKNVKMWKNAEVFLKKEKSEKSKKVEIYFFKSGVSKTIFWKKKKKVQKKIKVEKSKSIKRSTNFFLKKKIKKKILKKK